MAESKDDKRDAQDSGTQGQGMKTRDDEATSKETLRDLRETQKTPAAKGEGSSEGSAGSSTPSPDGAFDESGGGGRADGSDTGGPM
ncbi:MAG TPA: hypothetical protein VNA19_14585 [Pyrinomonadaceae bacterium]|nr:hypothetical protein [Pyrinomonadaceae bacterium]